MREFSLVYGRFRQLPLILAILVIGGVLFLLARDDAGAESEMPEPLSPSVVQPVGATEPEATTTTADWSKATADGAEVPFISLQPAPDAMTDAGERLVAEGQSENDTDS